MTQAAFTPTLPSESESILAKETSRVLASRIKNGERLRLRILDEGTSEETLNLPRPAVQLLLRILEEMARGNAVTLIPIHAELTTQEAADLLQMSRPSLIQLLNEGKIQFRRVGSHRRIRFEDLIGYKRCSDAERRKVLEELAAYDQEIGI